MWTQRRNEKHPRRVVYIFSQAKRRSSTIITIRDGENTTGEVLGVFNGGHPLPKERIFFFEKPNIRQIRMALTVDLLQFAAKINVQVSLIVQPCIVVAFIIFEVTNLNLFRGY